MSLSHKFCGTLEGRVFSNGSLDTTWSNNKKDFFSRRVMGNGDNGKFPTSAKSDVALGMLEALARILPQVQLLVLHQLTAWIDKIRRENERTWILQSKQLH
jgi:hypothetical protein